LAPTSLKVKNSERNSKQLFKITRYIIINWPQHFFTSNFSSHSSRGHRHWWASI